MKANLRKILIALGGLIAIAGIVALVFLIINRNKNMTLSILVAPTGAKITINGKEYTNGNYQEFPASKISVTIERDGFDTKELELEGGSNKVVKIQTYLETQNLEKYREMGDSYRVLRLIADYSDTKISNFITESNKIEEIKYKLPVWTMASFSNSEVHTTSDGFDTTENKNPGIKLVDGNQELECEKMSCIKALISGKRTSKEDQAINDKIRELGYNPSDYQIIYVENWYD